MPDLSERLLAIVDALPLRPGRRVLEIGCGPGAMAREMARRVAPDGHVLAVDRSPGAIAQLERSSGELIAAGLLSCRISAAEDLDPRVDEVPYDLAVAVRVGAFDGRHPEVEAAALERVRRMLAPGGVLLIDGGDPLRRIELD